jgi:hypothetical protein
MSQPPHSLPWRRKKIISNLDQRLIFSQLLTFMDWRVFITGVEKFEVFLTGVE